jgi:hypothetical protein
MKSDSLQEDAMGAKSKSGKLRGALRKPAATPQGRRARRASRVREPWEQTAQVPDERADELDCQRIVQGESGRSLPPYFDDYN